jgi:hypothetical protein
MAEQKSIKHNRTTYVYRGCRCDVCKAANSEYDRRRYRGSRSRPRATKDNVFESVRRLQEEKHTEAPFGY